MTTRRTRTALRVLVALCSTAVQPARLHGQAGPVSCEVLLSAASFVNASADVARVLDLTGPASRRSYFLRRSSDELRLDACSAPTAVTELARRLSVDSVPVRGAAVLPVDLFTSFNSAYPRDWNDGSVWSGRGFSSSLRAGALFRWGSLEAGVAPVIAAQQNEKFRILEYPDPLYSRFIDRWQGRFIDLPQRFGRDVYATVDPGHSFVRVHAGGVRAGISTENLTWGAARRNPLLLSGTAAGFPHVFFESSRGHDVAVGAAEWQLFYGRLSESDYFDSDADNDRRALNGVLLTLRPRGLDGLYLGAGRLHMQAWPAGLSARDLLVGPFAGIDPNSAGLPRDLRLFGVFLRWATAPGGFEVYGEWARQDEWKHWVRLLNPVESSQAYTLGAQKIVRRGDNAVRLSAEITHLADALAHRNIGRGLQSIYVSPAVPQGHTHRGQLLGAAIGPGSEAQFIGADVFWRHGRTSLSIERARYDDDAYHAVWSQAHVGHGHDTELSLRAGHLLALSRLSVEGELGYSWRWSRDLIGLHHVNFPGFPYYHEQNFHLRVAARWLPPVP